MNPDKTNKLIAELMGWIKDDPTVEDFIWLGPKGEVQNGPPQYSSDLNACAEFEREMTKIQQWNYPMNLRRVVMDEMDTEENSHPDTGILPDFFFYSATAPQRCLAFIRTVAPDREKEIYD